MASAQRTSKKFPPRPNISKYNTRKIDDFEVPRLCLEYSKKSFGYQGASTWNEIPKQIVAYRGSRQFLKYEFLVNLLVVLPNNTSSDWLKIEM